jgi:hypothetical protein
MLRNRSTSMVDSRTKSTAVGRFAASDFVRVADDDADSPSGQRPEGILVGDVVPEIQRHIFGVETQRLQLQPFSCRSTRAGCEATEKRADLDASVWFGPFRVT